MFSYWADSRQRAIYRTHELTADYPVIPEKVRDGVRYVQTLYYYEKDLQVGSRRDWLDVDAFHKRILRKE